MYLQQGLHWDVCLYMAVCAVVWLHCPISLVKELYKLHKKLSIDFKINSTLGGVPEVESWKKGLILKKDENGIKNTITFLTFWIFSWI